MNTVDPEFQRCPTFLPFPSDQNISQKVGGSYHPIEVSGCKFFIKLTLTGRKCVMS